MAVHDNHCVEKFLPIPGSCLLAPAGRPTSLNVNEKYKKVKGHYLIRCKHLYCTWY